MAIPKSTFIWPDAMDPSDKVDYIIDCSGFLEPSELIASYTLIIPSESVLIGLTLGSGSYASHVLDGTQIVLWLSIEDSLQQQSIFVDEVILPIEVNVTTTSSPARKRQRTVAVKVVQK